jgi:hypothetical protein
MSRSHSSSAGLRHGAAGVITSTTSTRATHPRVARMGARDSPAVAPRNASGVLGSPGGHGAGLPSARRSAGDPGGLGLLGVTGPGMPHAAGSGSPLQVQAAGRMSLATLPSHSTRPSLASVAGHTSVVSGLSDGPGRPGALILAFRAEGPPSHNAVEAPLVAAPGYTVDPVRSQPPVMSTIGPGAHSRAVSGVSGPDKQGKGGAGLGQVAPVPVPVSAAQADPQPLPGCVRGAQQDLAHATADLTSLMHKYRMRLPLDVQLRLPSDPSAPSWASAIKMLT